MISWAKFLNDEPTYSDHVYHPTPSILANNVRSLAHQDMLMNASPLDNADDCRFVIAQLSRSQRENHFSTFHADHHRQIQAAIDTLVGYYERHERKPLEAYDRAGWPGTYAEVGKHEDRQRASFERMQGRHEPGEAVGSFSPGLLSTLEKRRERPALTDESSSEDVSESAFHCEEMYDFPSLAGLSLDSVDGMFGSDGVFKPDMVFAPELSLSPAPTHSLSPSQEPVPESLTRHSRPLQSSSPPRLAPLAAFVTATARTPIVLPLTSAISTRNHALSIANLIHHHTSPPPISPSTNADAGASDPELRKLLSVPEADLLPDTLSSAGHRSAYGQPPPTSPNVNLAEESHNFRDHVRALRMEVLPIPRPPNRTFRPTRMRRDSRTRAASGKAFGGSRRGSIGEGQQPRENARFEMEPDRKRQRRDIMDDHSPEPKGQFQPYSYEYGDFDWNQPIGREATASASSSAADPVSRNEDLDRCTAAQLPTSAIKYEPLDDPNFVPQYQQHSRPQQRAVSLKRKDRDDDDARAGPSSKRQQQGSWTISGAPYWHPCPSYTLANPMSLLEKQERGTIPRQENPD